MDIGYDISPALRSQMKHHEPIVLIAAGFKGGQELWPEVSDTG